MLKVILVATIKMGGNRLYTLLKVLPVYAM